MDKKTVFVKTDKGESEAQGETDLLFGDVKRIFNLVDDESTVAEITKRAPPSLRDSMESMLQELVDGGYIRDMRAPANESAKPALKIAAPAFKMATPKAPVPPSPATPARAASPAMPTAAPSFTMPEMPAARPAPASARPAESAAPPGNGDLDFSFITSGAAPAPAAKPADNQKELAEARARAEAQAREAAQAKAAEDAAREEAKRKAYEAAKIKAQIEVAARAKIEAEAKAKREAEVAKARVEAEVRARMEVEAKAKIEAEMIRKKAEQEAEKLRRELEEARIKAEMEQRIRLEAEAKARAEHEARLKREAEAERLRLEKERAELEAARIKAEAELRMREEAEARVKAAIEERLKSEAQARQAEENRLKEMARQQAAKAVHTKEEMDPGEKLRQSFSQLAGKGNNDKNANTGSFKLEAFSLVNTGKNPAIASAAATPPPLPGAGSKVKAALEERARKRAEEERIKTEQLAQQHLQENAAQQQVLAQQQAQNEAARMRMQQEEAAAREKAEQEASRLKAEHEAYMLRAKQEEEQANALAEQQKLADQQSRQWEEAQQRAAVLAQAEQERLEREAAEARVQARRKPSRGPRRKLAAGPLIGGAFVLLVVALFALPFVWPTDDYIAPLEGEISAQLKQPVKISKIDFAILPMPKLVARSVNIGRESEIKAEEIELNFDISALFAPVKSIRDMNLRNVIMEGASVNKSIAWLQQAGGMETYPVARMNFVNLQVFHPALKLPAISGRAEFDAFGKFIQADLKSQDEKLTMGLKPQPGGVAMEFNASEGSLPIFPQLKLNDLSFNVTAMENEYVITDFFAHIYAGTITGKGRLSFNQGWKLQGILNARNVDVQRMFAGSVLSGELAGETNVAMAAAALPDLGRSMRLDGSFEINNGEFKKIDIEAIARSGARPGVAGHTSFSSISGTFSADNDMQHIVISKLVTKNAITSAVMDVNSQHQLSGKVQLDIKSVMGSGTVPMKLSGTPDDPVLQAGH